MADTSPSSRWTYLAFGMTVESEIELAGFVPAPPTETPDVVVRLDAPASEFDEGAHVRAVATGVLNASVQNGREMRVQVNPDADPLYVSAIITGELFSVILRQRGLLVLHSSGVVKDGRAVGFIGDSGWGKSTLAASLVDRGWQLLTDDLLVLDGLDGKSSPTVVPTHPTMRLSPEAFDQVAADGVEKGQAHSLTTKVQVDQTSSFSDRRADLTRVFILDPRFAQTHEAQPLSSRDAAEEFVRHTRGRRLLASSEFTASHLRQCADLARRVPTFQLRRQFGLEHLSSLCDLIETTATPA